MVRHNFGNIPLILVLVLITLSCGGKTTTPQAKIGARVPELELADLDGTTVKLSDYFGSVILLEFWATWCPDCREVLPHIQTLHDKAKGAGYSVVTVSVDAESETVRTFMKENSYTFQVLFGGTQIREQFAVKAIPTLYIIDKSAVIRASLVEYGEKGSEEVDRFVRQLIDEQ